MTVINDIIDKEAVLADIDTFMPQGSDIRENSRAQFQYYDLKEHCQSIRYEAEAALLQGESSTRFNEWDIVIKKSAELLAKNTKDIEICSWLIEGLVRKYHFKGLILGFEVLIALIEKYSDTIYPLPDEEGNKTRLMPIASLCGTTNPGTLISPLNLAPLLITDNATISLWDILQIEKNQSGSQRSGNSSDTSESEINYQTVVEVISKEELENHQAEIIHAIDKVKELDSIMSKHYGQDSPVVNQLKTLLVNCQKALTKIATIVASSNIAPPLAENSKKDEPTSGAMFDRNKATAGIKVAMEYFQKMEPHSPVGILLEKAVRWSGVRIHEIFQEIIVIKNEDARQSNAFGIYLFGDK